MTDDTMAQPTDSALPTSPGLYLSSEGEVWLRHRHVGAGGPWERNSDGSNDVSNASPPLDRLVPLSPEETDDILRALLLADAWEARAEFVWSQKEDPVRPRWRALARRLNGAI